MIISYSRFSKDKFLQEHLIHIVNKFLQEHLIRVVNEIALEHLLKNSRKNYFFKFNFLQELIS